MTKAIELTQEVVTAISPDGHGLLSMTHIRLDPNATETVPAVLRDLVNRAIPIEVKRTTILILLHGPLFGATIFDFTNHLDEGNRLIFEQRVILLSSDVQNIAQEVVKNSQEQRVVIPGSFGGSKH